VVHSGGSLPTSPGCPPFRGTGGSAAKYSSSSLQFWEALKPFQFRPHWGKYLPFASDNPRAWLDYISAQYPRWSDFMRLREQMDPRQVFVSDYWRSQLGIAPPQVPVSAG
jgi:hypothetical protein